MRRNAFLLILFFLLGGFSHAGNLEIIGYRLMDFEPRTSVMVLVKNNGSQPVKIEKTSVNGIPIEKATQPGPEQKNKIGQVIDWYAVRPGTIPAREAGTIILGYMDSSVLRRGLTLTLGTDQGDEQLALRSLRSQEVVISRVAFDKRLRKVLLFVRNDSYREVRIEEVLFNGQSVRADIEGDVIGPNMLGKVAFSTGVRLEEGQDCNFIVRTDRTDACAWLRAYPAECVNYSFYGMHCDKRDLAEKNMHAYVSHEVAGGHAGHAIDENGGTMPQKVQDQMASRAKSFGANPRSWAWYMQDDAGWGRPTPRALLTLGDFIRENGSKDIQFLCNPADLRRYAWTHDLFMNYSYLVTHQGYDPTIFTGGRSIDHQRKLNEPIPILYLVDTVGQSVRWITVAEEELASYAMLGRGATHPGWFLIPSLWQQGGALGGGIDHLETMPWRYQEGARANAAVWNQVGRIGAFFEVIGEYMATGAKLPEQMREDRIEVLPLLCKDDVVITTLLNRKLRCVYPRDFTGEKEYESGGILLVPRRDFSVEHAMPSWIKAADVLAFDHQRGVRKVPFSQKGEKIEIQVDAIDTATVLLICPESSTARAVQKALEEKVKPSVDGSPIRCDEVAAIDSVQDDQNWRARDCRYRTRISMSSSPGSRDWVKVALPMDDEDPWRPIGYFDPDSVEVYVGAVKVPVRVDYRKTVYDPRQRMEPWDWNQNDRKMRAAPSVRGLQILSRQKENGYSNISLKPNFDPEYDILEIMHDAQGRLYPIMGFATNGQNGQTALSAQMQRRIWRESEIFENVLDDLDLSRIHWKRVAKEAAAKQGKGGSEIQSGSLGYQVYDGKFLFGPIYQSRSRPVVYFRPGAMANSAGEKEIYVYWDYQHKPELETAAVEADQLRGSVVEGQVSNREGWKISEARANITGGIMSGAQIECDTALDGVWMEARDRDGRLRAWRNLESRDQRRWKLAGHVNLNDGEDVRIYCADAFGRTVAVKISEPESVPMLSEIARVEGQVESMDCSEDGKKVIVGADKVYLFEEGRPLWAYDPGENRRQPGNFGPGRNVEQVGIRGDGKSIFARTFEYNRSNKQYQESLIHILNSSNGKAAGKLDCNWRYDAWFTDEGAVAAAQNEGRDRKYVAMDPAGGKVTGDAEPKSGTVQAGEYEIAIRNQRGKPRAPILKRKGEEVYEITWPAYTQHKLLTTQGQVIAANTQGQIDSYDSSGQKIWSQRRLSRIDDAVVLEDKGVLALAYKRYLKNWQWECRPVLELIDLATGQTKAVYQGEKTDDYGHYGTHLELAASQDGAIVYLGGPSGRIYRLSVP